jgi:hypothetical protein
MTYAAFLITDFLTFLGALGATKTDDCLEFKKPRGLIVPQKDRIRSADGAGSGEKKNCGAGRRRKGAP